MQCFKCQNNNVVKCIDFCQILIVPKTLFRTCHLSHRISGEN